VCVCVCVCARVRVSKTVGAAARGRRRSTACAVQHMCAWPRARQPPDKRAQAGTRTRMGCPARRTCAALCHSFVSPLLRHPHQQRPQTPTPALLLLPPVLLPPPPARGRGWQRLWRP
jgi:hypothetical protein